MIKLSPNKNLNRTESLAAVQSSYKSLMARSDLGFIHLPKNKEALSQSKNVADEILKHFDHLVLIGIGGSSMGPRALAEISKSDRISFLDNVDSTETKNVIARLRDLSKTAWVVISKSGSTIEVLCNLDLVAQIYDDAKIPFWANTFFITESVSNPLFDLAQKHQRPVLEIPLDVGGRFSVLSPVGLLVAEYLKLSGADLLTGAQQAAQSEAEIVECVTQYLESFQRGENITLFWFYNSNMRWFGSWLQQLWAESLGKKESINKPPAFGFSTPMVSIGSCDQHSILQQVVDGPKNKLVNIFRFRSIESSQYTIKNPLFKETKMLAGLNYGQLIRAEAKATEAALQQSGVSTLGFEIENFDAKTMGFLFMFFQLVVATLGQHCHINAFDQPGVALGKKLTLEHLLSSTSH